jgi:HAMP domain-containing protein
MSDKISVLEDQLKAAEEEEQILNDLLVAARKRHEDAQDKLMRIRRELAQEMREALRPAAAKEGQS